MSVLEYDSPVMTGIGKVVDIFWLSVLWLLCCLPVVTVGASTAALYRTAVRSIREGRGYVTSTFFHALRQDLKVGLELWLVFLALLVADYLGFILAASVPERGLGFLVLCLYAMIGFVLLATMIYAFPVLSKCSMKCFAILRFGFGLAVKHFPYTLLMAVITVAAALLVWCVPLFVFCVPAIAGLLCSLPLERILLRYTPQSEE